MEGSSEINNQTYSNSTIDGFVCEDCKSTQFNPAIGRCSKCLVPPEDAGWCPKCDKFWLNYVGHCPEDGQHLQRYKAGMALRRLGNFIIDCIAIRITIGIIIGLAIILTPKTHVMIPSHTEASDANVVVSNYPATSAPSLVAVREPWYLNNWLFILGAYFGYYFVFESFSQRTLGKFITGTKVVTIYGNKPNIATIAKRSLIRLIPFEPFSVLGIKVCGWHDRWTGTYVIRDSIFKSSRNSGKLHTDS